MGTSFTVKLIAEADVADKDAILAEIEAELATINKRMSTYDPDSELSRWNAARTTDWFAVSAETAAVVNHALRIGRLTDGAFDVTLDPLIRLWQFGPGAKNLATAEDNKIVPPHADIAKTLRLVGFTQIETRSDPPAVRKKLAEMQIDLSGIAKGYAVDRVAAVLERHGYRNYMVEIGGEVRTSGHNLAGRLWRIGIETPTSGIRKIESVVSMGKGGIGLGAMATSGDYRNYFERDGVRYSHLLDPRFGRPITHRLASVTVLAETCAEADALATGLVVLGPDAGFELAQSQGIAAAFIVRVDDGFEQKRTSHWPADDVPDKTEETAGQGSVITTYVAAFLVLAALMLALSIGPILRKRKMQCSCKTASQIMNATDPRREKSEPAHPKSSPLLPILPDDADEIRRQ